MNLQVWRIGKNQIWGIKFVNVSQLFLLNKNQFCDKKYIIELNFLFVVVLEVLFGKIAKCWIVTFFNRITTRTICIHRKLCGLKYLTSMISTRSPPIATNVRINVLLCKYQWLFIFYVSSKVVSLNIDEVQLVLVHILVRENNKF